MRRFNLCRWTRFAAFFVSMALVVAGQAFAQSAPAACNQGGTVTLPASSSPFYFATITIQPGQSATLTVSGSNAFASGFIPGPGGGSVTTYQNTSMAPITTQAAIVAQSGGTFTWSLTGSTCASSPAPSLDGWALWLLGAALLLFGAAWCRGSALRHQR